MVMLLPSSDNDKPRYSNYPLPGVEHLADFLKTGEEYDYALFLQKALPRLKVVLWRLSNPPLLEEDLEEILFETLNKFYHKSHGIYDPKRGTPEQFFRHRFRTTAQRLIGQYKQARRPTVLYQEDRYSVADDYFEADEDVQIPSHPPSTAVSPTEQRVLDENSYATFLASFSPVERDFVDLVDKGLGEAQIAKLLGRSLKEVHNIRLELHSRYHWFYT